MEQPEGGPYLQAAFFCERLLEEADGVRSAIRIVDTVIIQGGESSPEAAPATVNLTLFIAFKAGQARGSHDLTVEMEEPSEDDARHERKRYTQPIIFDSTWDQGVTIVMPVAMTAVDAGLYWFTVALSGRFVTRVPLRVAVQVQMPPIDPE